MFIGTKEKKEFKFVLHAPVMGRKERKSNLPPKRYKVGGNQSKIDACIKSATEDEPQECEWNPVHISMTCDLISIRKSYISATNIIYVNKIQVKITDTAPTNPNPAQFLNELN